MACICVVVISEVYGVVLAVVAVRVVVPTAAGLPGRGVVAGVVKT